jgi:GTP-binding protein HflX
LTTGGRQRRRLTATETDLGVVRQRAYLVSVIAPGITDHEAALSIDELGRLTLTAGSDPEGQAVLHRDRIDPATFIGKGQAQRIQRESTAADVDVVVFQVELAQLRYRLPRLRGRGIAMSRLAGGIGTRGPGETKLETDRRRISTRISKLEKELAHIGKVRRTQRKARTQADATGAALVGYTNAGKSTLLNALTDAGILTEDQLFSTVDPTVRRLELASGQVLLSDTVGFVRDLPHELVEAFRSTLEQITEADVLVHVVDASDPDPERQIAAVHEVLAEIGALGLPELLVFNKADVASDSVVTRLLSLHPGSIALSARQRTGLDELEYRLTETRRADHVMAAFAVPYEHGEVVAGLHRDTEVLEETHEESATHLKVRGPAAALNHYEEYRI